MTIAIQLEETPIDMGTHNHVITFFLVSHKVVNIVYLISIYLDTIYKLGQESKTLKRKQKHICSSFKIAFQSKLVDGRR